MAGNLAATDERLGLTHAEGLFEAVGQTVGKALRGDPRQRPRPACLWQTSLSSGVWG